MVTNQDGMGTPSFPEERFWPIHHHIVKSFENEGVSFSATYIDRSLASEHPPNRKLGFGMVKDYLNNKNYDIPNSYVIGDRITDVQLAKNLGCKGIWLKTDISLGAAEIASGIAALHESGTIALETTEWSRIYEFLKLGLRKVVHERNTKE